MIRSRDVVVQEIPCRQDGYRTFVAKIVIKQTFQEDVHTNVAKQVVKADLESRIYRDAYGMISHWLSRRGIATESPWIYNIGGINYTPTGMDTMGVVYNIDRRELQGVLELLHFR